MPKQDAGYKLLFSHYILVRDLVHAFFPYSNDPKKAPPPLAIQKISGSWIDENKLRRRDNDIAWILTFAKVPGVFQFSSIIFPATRHRVWLLIQLNDSQNFCKCQ